MKKKKQNKKPCSKPKFTQEQLIERLKKHISDPKTELIYKNPFELLVVVILSAQATDKKINEVSPSLFEKYPDAKSLADAELEDLYKILKPINYYKTKAERIKNMAQTLIEKFNGEIPQTIEELTQLEGVGRKTASVILVNGFKKPAIVVDTHVKRVSQRLGITCNNNPEKIEHDLAEFFSKEHWVYISNALVLFGRYICKAQKPKCDECHLIDICPFENKNL